MRAYINANAPKILLKYKIPKSKVIQFYLAVTVHLNDPISDTRELKTHLV